MSVQIISGAGSTTLTVDTTSNAARTTLYDSTGVELYPKPTTGSYMACIEVRATAANAAATTCWAMRNVSSSSPTAYIRRIRGILAFDGTGTSVTGLRIGFFRHSTATFTGGTAQTIIKKDTSYGPPSAITDIRQTGTTLTLGSVAIDASPFAVFAISANNTTATATNAICPFNIDFMQENTYSPFRLRSGEGLNISYQTVAAIIGMTITGFVEWDERA